MTRKTQRQRDALAYRGYLIKYYVWDNVFFIIKDGFNIGSASSLEEAKAIIKELTP